MTTTIIGSECKFCINIPSRFNDQPDMHMIKEQQHHADGSIKPHIKFVANFKRPLYVTRPDKRNHQQKKEYEKTDNLLEKSVTQSGLRDEVARLLDKSWSNDHLKKLSASPYLYGTDVSSTTIIKQMYQEKYPDLQSKYSVAAFDIETDVINGTDDILMATITFEDKSFTAVVGSFLQGFSSIDDRFSKAVNRYIGEYTLKHNMVPELYIAKDAVDVVRSVFNKAHEWKPDFLAIWNMNFDIPRVLEILERNKIDARDILCDPSVPRKFRICKYKPGPNKKTTASGKVTPISPAAQWHTLICTSSFYVIDAMCSYKHIRTGQQEESSYALDAILNKELGIRKLKFEEASQYTGLRWHQVMQTDFKIEYIVYNIFDCISMLELDIKTKDLAYTLPSYSDASDFSDFKSQPKRISDALYFFLMEKGYVLGTVGGSFGDDAEPDDKETVLGLENWIITLPAHLMVPGMKCILEDRLMATGIRCFVYDSDAVAAYPSVISAANVSKSTTKRELISIKGIDESVFRMQNLNLIMGSPNALEYATTMFNLAKPQDLLKSFSL